MKNDLLEKERQLDHLNYELRNRSDNSNITQSYFGSQQSSIDLQNKLIEAEKTQLKLQHEIEMNKLIKNESDKKVDELSQTLKNTQNDYTKLKDKYSQLKYQYFGEQKSLSNKVIEYENQIKYLQNQLSVSEQIHSQKYSEIQNSFQNLETLKSINPELYSQAQLLMVQNEELKAQLRVKDDTINALNNSILSIKQSRENEFNDLKNKIQSLNELNNKLTIQINQQKTELFNHKNQVNHFSVVSDAVLFFNYTYRQKNQLKNYNLN